MNRLDGVITLNETSKARAIEGSQRPARYAACRRPRSSTLTVIFGSVLTRFALSCKSADQAPQFVLPEGVAPDSVEARLLEEFYPAYSADAPKVTATREFALRAAPTEADIVDEKALKVWAFNGVRVPNAMDGVPGVTQPPTEPGENFVYEFVSKDAGMRTLLTGEGEGEASAQ